MQSFLMQKKWAENYRIPFGGHCFIKTHASAIGTNDF
jgi:hypothetical protein